LRVIDDVRAGRRLSADALGAAIEPIVASVIRNADAFFWLDALRKRDAYSYSHAVNCCALATSFGRHLGFPRAMLVDLASAGMLMDIGKAALPEELLQRPGPVNGGELDVLRSHVERSLEMLDRAGIAGDGIRLMIGSHHERHDGSGYPSGLAGAAIPLTGRMLGLVDTYDALSSERPHQRPMARHDVLQFLYRERDHLFQSELIEQLSQSLGVYPTGSLVELSSGEVAVVMAQNPARRLYPRVTVLTAKDKSLDPAFRQIDLWPLANRVERAERVWIERALPPGAYGLDTTELYL
jgi:HD-GYP domain-containing protein (c-di-GMP phosphodiesterase class II)